MPTDIGGGIGSPPTVRKPQPKPKPSTTKPKLETAAKKTYTPPTPPPAAVNAALSDRATKLHPRLLTENPGMASELLLGPTKTAKLADVSLAAYHAWQMQNAENLRLQSEHDAGLGLQVTPALEAAGNRAKIGETFQVRGRWYIKNGDGQIEPLDKFDDPSQLEGKSLVQQAAEGAGKVVGGIFAAPIAVIGTGADIAERHLPDVIAHPLDVAQEAVGDVLGAAGVAGQFATRNVEAALVNTQRGFTGQDMHLEYFTSWHEAEEGDRSPFTKNLAEIIGTTADDPHLQGLFDVTDLTGDLATQTLMFEGLAAFKTSRTVPAGAGGSISGEAFVSSFGKKVVKSVTETLNKDTFGTPRAVLEDTYKNINPSLSDELASIGPHPTEAEVGRVIADHIDNAPTKSIPRVEAELKSVRDALAEKSAPRAETYPTSVEELRGKAEFDPLGAVVRAKELGTAHADTPIEVRINEDGSWSLLDGAHRLDAAERAGVENVPVRFIDESGATVSPEGVGVGADILKAQEAALVERLTQLENFEPVWEFPKKSRIRPIMRGVSETRTGRMLNYFFGESTGKFRISQFADDMAPNKEGLIDPGAPTKPAGWQTHNVDELRKTMNIAHTPKALQRAVIENMSAVERGDLSFYSWRLQISEALERGLTKDGKRVLTPEGQQAIRFANRSIEERMSSPIEVTATMPDGTTVTQLKNVHEIDGQPLPSQPNQFLTHTELPDVRLLQDAASSIRYADQWIRSKPVFGKVYGALKVPLDVAHFAIFTMPRLILRPSILINPRILAKIQIDQGVRLGAEGLNPFKLSRESTEFIDPITGAPVKSGVKAVLGEDTTPMGAVASEMSPATETLTYKLDTRGLDPTLRPKDADLVVQAKYDHIDMLRTDPLTQRLAVAGPEATLAYIELHPESWLAKRWNRDLAPSLERAGRDPLEFLQAKDMEIEQATGGDPALREAISTHNWKGGGAEPVDIPQMVHLRDELGEARATLAETEGSAARNELNLRIEQLERREAWLQRQTEPTGDISLGDETRTKQQIMDNWQNGTYKMTNEVLVKKSNFQGETVTGSILDRARASAQRVNRTLYKGLRPMSWADAHATRGSMFSQMFERVYKELRSHGYDEASAQEWASYRSAYLTSDLLYDISARSSVDRRMKDYFWFSPVWREQMTTYLHKIPSRAYWAPGIVLEYSVAHTMLNGLKDMGFVTDEVVNAEGDTAPYFNINGVKISVGGLNPVTPGTSGLLPTLSPGAETILDMTANKVPKKYQHFFDAFAEQFTFDKDTGVGPSYVPRSIVTVAELFGVHVPMDTLSLDAWKEAYNKAEVQSRRWAMSELASEGILPPAGGEENPAAFAAYEAQVSERAQHYEQGLAFIHILGTVALPGSIRQSASTPAGDAWYKWRYETGPLVDMEYGTDEFFAIQDEYLRAHPGAWPYAVGAHPGNFSDPGYTDRTLNPDDYFRKAVDQASYWREDSPTPEAASTPAEEHAAVTDPATFSTLSPRRQARAVATWTVTPVNELTDVQADAVGLPQFAGRDQLLSEVGNILDQYEKQYSSDMSDDQKAVVAAHRDFLLAKAIVPYGAEGQQVLDYVQATPAKRLNRSGYFSGPQIDIAITEAGNITRHAIATGYSPKGASETTGVLQRKVDLYKRIDTLRKLYPALDRQLRYAELGLGDKDGPAGRVATYEYLFFDSGVNYFGYQDAIVEAMNAS